MSIQYYPNGIGGTVGDSLDTCKPLQTSGNVWYVSSLIGTDAVSPAGQNREKPLATIAQAVTNASDDDIVVFLQGHTQTLTAVQVVNKRLTFIGEGTVSGKPGVSFLNNQAAGTLLLLSAAGAELRNLYFPPNVQACTGTRVAITGTDCVVSGCYFECGATDIGNALDLAASRIRVERSTFISVATSLTAQPKLAIAFPAAVNAVGSYLQDVVVSAGTVGFSNFAAIDLTAATSVTQVKWQNLNLLLGADVAMGATTTGRVNVQLATGGSRVAWG